MPERLKIWVDEEDTFEVKIWVVGDRKEQGRVRVLRDDKGVEGAVGLVFTFKRPFYKDIVVQRRQCNSFDAANGVFTIDSDKMNQKRFREWLRGWNLHEVYGEKFKMHTVEGMMDDESMKKLMKLDPMIIMELIDRLRERVG